MRTGNINAWLGKTDDYQDPANWLWGCVPKDIHELIAGLKAAEVQGSHHEGSNVRCTVSHFSESGDVEAQCELCKYCDSYIRPENMKDRCTALVTFPPGTDGQALRAIFQGATGEHNVPNGKDE